MIGQIGNFGRKVDMGRKMNDPDGALDPWSCLLITQKFVMNVHYLILKQPMENIFFNFQIFNKKMQKKEHIKPKTSIAQSFFYL